MWKVWTAPARNFGCACAGKRIFGVWHTQTVEELFAYVQRSQASERPLRLAGFDVKISSGSGIKDRPFEPLNARTWAKTKRILVPRDQYDAILFIDESTPPVFR